MEAPKRPSAAWVIVVPATIDGDITQSTLEGLKKAILSSPSYTTRPQDIEIVDKTGLNLYANEQVWERLLNDADFPYIRWKIASDGTLEVRYIENSKDAKPVSEGISLEDKLEDEDTPLKRGGQRGTGKSGQGGQPGGGGGDGQAGGGEGGEGQGGGEAEGQREGASGGEGQEGGGGGKGREGGAG